MPAFLFTDAALRPLASATKPTALFRSKPRKLIRTFKKRTARHLPRIFFISSTAAAF
jgi:hypothetical protein